MGEAASERVRVCRICGNGTGNRSHLAREMMFGLRDAFEYLECGRCGCLQVAEIPADLARYYPDTFGSLCALRDRRPAPWMRWLWRRRARYALGERVTFGRVASRLLQHPKIGIWGEPDPFTWLRRCGAGLDARILDVGCGTGSLLLALRDYGFTRSAGVDPMLPRTLRYSGGVRIHGGPLADVPGPFDVVMFHHCLEHVPDLLETLGEAGDRLAPDCWAIIRTPMVGGHAWRAYGIDWVQLDAPCHRHIPTLRSMRHLAQQAGLEIVAIEWNSFAVQFWGSEQYRLGIPLMDERSHLVSQSISPFERAQIESGEARARELNAKGDGDSTCFYLRRMGCARR